jgi:regulator of protease activity HflC (stomatin/prohibitin superfamily)
MLRQIIRKTNTNAFVKIAVPSASPTKRNFITVVNQGFEAYRTTLGKNPIRLEPGLHLALPILHNIQKVDMRECGMTVTDITAYTKDNVPVKLNVTLFYKVRDAYSACFNVSNYWSSISNVGTSSIRGLVGTLDYDYIIATRGAINTLFSADVDKSIEKWGISCTKAEIQSFGPLNHGVEKQLEKQMEAERDRRQQELNTLAQINIADGQKKSMILHSEGKLTASKNEAEADFIRRQREADGIRYAIEQETVATVEQIKEISNALGSNEQLATKFLLARRRFDELQSIANGPNNTVYFVNNEKEGYDNMKVFTDMLNTKQ